ncbi:hypothetical protein WN51_06553 [Melipona quadrifasciata]|uniref:Uncharacterized protein n=1 Tax=Melipona quadrifasciata TaxID=166423 RepID=A0A0M8ZTZ6_9HYME|nr:hypothetical protein WN51_06553 [Melipona quadrifasciata]
MIPAQFICTITKLIEELKCSGPMIPRLRVSNTRLAQAASGCAPSVETATQAYLSKEWNIAVKVKKREKKGREGLNSKNGGQGQKVPQGRTVSERRKTKKKEEDIEQNKTTIKETCKVTATTRTRQYDSELERKIKQILKQEKTNKRLNPTPNNTKKMKQKIEQPKKQTQNTETSTYEELKEINKKLNQKIENLEKRMEEIIKFHNRHQEGINTENKEEKMEIEENEKKKKTHNQKPETNEKPPTSSHQPPKHLVISNKGKPQTQTLVRPQTFEQSQPQLDTRPNKNNDSNKQKQRPPIILYGNEQINKKHIREKN